MNTIDKVLLEWSLKTDKGYPDVNSKEDMDLFESMFGFKLNEEKQERQKITIEDLLQLLSSKRSSLDSDFIEKIYHTVSNKGLKLGTIITDRLDTKGLSVAKNELFSIIDKYPGMEKKLKDFFNDKSRQLSISDIKSSEGIVDLAANKTKLPSGFIKELINAGRASEGGKGVGLGEAFLAVLGRDGKKLKVGDVSIDGKEIEVKGKGGRLIGRGESLSEFYKDLANIDQNISHGREGASGYIKNIFNKYEKTSSEDSIKKDLIAVLDKHFPGSNKVDLTSRESVKNRMLEWYVNFFFNNEAKNVDYIGVFMDSKFKLYSKKEFKEAILSRKITTQNFSKTNKSPQLVGID